MDKKVMMNDTESDETMRSIYKSTKSNFYNKLSDEVINDTGSKSETSGNVTCKGNMTCNLKDTQNVIVHNELFESTHNELLQSSISSCRNVIQEINSASIKLDGTGGKETIDINNISENSAQKDYSDITIKSASMILECINEIDIKSENLPKQHINSFFDATELEQLTQITQYISDAVLTIEIPQTLHYKKGINISDLIDIYINSVLRVTFLMVKCEDYMTCFGSSSTISFVNLLPALLCLSMYIYHNDTKCYVIPSSSSTTPPLMIHVSDLLHIFPTDIVNGLSRMNETYFVLNFDWTMTLLCVSSFFYLPVSGYEENLEKARNKYVSLLKKYVLWKFGAKTASNLFPEILKFMDAIHVQALEMADLELHFDENEIYHVAKRLELFPNVKNIDDIDIKTINNLKLELKSKQAISLSSVNSHIRDLLHTSLYSRDNKKTESKLKVDSEKSEPSVNKDITEHNRLDLMIDISDLNELIEEIIK